MNNKVKTDEQLIEMVNQYMEKYPTATRNQVVLHATGNATRVRSLDKRGANTRWNGYFRLDVKTPA